MVDTSSRYDPSRKTVGAIYRDAQISSHDSSVECGDLTRELQKSLVDDLNDTIASNPYEGKSFYIVVHEKKDLQMPRAILRRMITSVKRPYPEDDTLVFFVNLETNTTEFCWCLPHWSEMDNVLINAHQYEKEYVNDIKAWKDNNLEHFGIFKVGNKLKANPNFKNRKLKKRH